VNKGEQGNCSRLDLAVRAERHSVPGLCGRGLRLLFLSRPASGPAPGPDGLRRDRSNGILREQIEYSERWAGELVGDPELVDNCRQLLAHAFWRMGR
jgi:hypothetical protein